MKKNIYKLNDKRNLIRNKLIVNKYAQEGAGRIIFTYSRYMHKIFGLNFYLENPPTCPLYTKFIYSFTACLIRARLIYETNLETNNHFSGFEWPDSGFKILDLITKRYIYRTLNLKIIYKKNLDYK